MRISKLKAVGAGPPLLAALAASSLAGVAMVIWLARTNSPWVVAGGVAVVLALVASLALQLGRLLARETEPVADRRRGWAGALRLAVMPGLLVPLVVAGAVAAAPRPHGTPAATVRDFLSAAVVDNDGVTACKYLTARSRVDFEGRNAVRSSCESFFGGAGLTLGGRTVSSNAQLDALHYRVTAQERDRLVTVSYRGQAIGFLLRPANAPELDEFQAPPTSWRIASSVNGLGEPVGAPPA